MKKIKRLDICKVILNKEKQEIIPCVVIQNDIANTYSPTVIVVPLEDNVKDTDVYCLVQTKTFGKKYAIVNRLVTVNKKNIVSEEAIESISATDILVEVNKYLTNL